MNMKEFFRRLKWVFYPPKNRIEVFYEETKDDRRVKYIVWHRGKRCYRGMHGVNEFNKASNVFQKQCDIAVGWMLERIKSENL